MIIDSFVDDFFSPPSRQLIAQLQTLIAQISGEIKAATQVSQKAFKAKVDALLEGDAGRDFFLPGEANPAANPISFEDAKEDKTLLSSG